MISVAGCGTYTLYMYLLHWLQGFFDLHTISLLKDQYTSKAIVSVSMNNLRGHCLRKAIPENLELF